MAGNHYNVPALQQGNQGPLNTAVHPSSLASVQPNTAPTRMANMSNVAFAEHQGQVDVNGVQIQFHNVAIRAESSRANMSGPNVKDMPIAVASNKQQLLSQGAPSSQHASLPCTPSEAIPCSPQSIPQSPLQITGGERGVVPHSSAGMLLPQEGAGPVVLQRTGEAEKAAGEMSLQTVVGKTPDVAFAVAKGEVLMEGKRQVVRQEIELTDDGQVRLREYIHTERVFYRHVVEVLYIAALNEPEDPEEEKLKEKCIDYCCQAFSCADGIKRLFCRRTPQGETKTSAIKKIEFMTPILRRGRSKGWVFHTDMIFPLVKNTFRNVWVGTEIVMVIVALGLSIASFSLGNNRVFNGLHLALTILGSILAITDGMILLGQSKCCGKRDSSDCEHTSEQTQDNPNEGSPGDVENGAPSCSGKCKQCIEKTKAKFDIGRMILAELIFYPLLICDIFEVVTGEAYHFSNAEDGISFVLFAISLGLVLFYVYIVRIIILIAANYHSQKRRPPLSNETPDKIDPTIRRSALYFQIYFIIHVFGQMVAQVLMIITIGIGIHEENKDTSDEPIRISTNLWYMIVAGYLLPVFGLLTFFVVTYFWVQEFPIGVCVDVLSILEAPGMDEVLDLKNKKAEGGQKLSKINRYIHFSELKKQFKTLRTTGFLDKFGYPFGSPQMVIVSMVYALLQLGFVIAASRSLGGDWAVFYVPAGIIGYLANIYVLTVAALWSLIIMGVILVVASIIAFIIFCFLLITCLSGASENRNRRS